MPKDAKTDGGRKATRRHFLAAVGAGAAAAHVAGAAGLKGAVAAEEPDRVYPNQDESEVRWGFLIDLRRCNGCNACAVACKTANDVRLGVFRSGVISHESGTYPATKRDFVPWLCNHCKNPPCLGGCPVDPVKASLTFPSGEKAEYWARATYQRPDGLVLVDQDRCIGCGACVTLCPFDARYLDRVAPGHADKCSMCSQRVEPGVVPACANTCPAGARTMGNLNDPNSEINQAISAAGGGVSTLNNAPGAEPQVFYIGLNQEAYDQGEEPRREAGFQ